jgi:Acetyltransferase (GNAT) domain
MHILWNQTDRPTWDKAHTLVGGALQQDWAYGTSMTVPGVTCHRAEVILNGEPVALAQFICRRYGFILSVALCTRGPIWLKPLPVDVKIKRSLPLSRPRIALFSPEITDPNDASVAQLIRVMTGYSTLMIDLTRSGEQLRAELDARWRNRLGAAEKSGITTINDEFAPEYVKWLLDAEQSQRAQKSFHGLPVAFVERYIEAGTTTKLTALMLHAEHHGKRIAAMLFLLHGSVATYHIGWADQMGRETNAHKLILWRAFEILRTRGINTLDMGGVNTHDLPGISRFKLGMGGTVVTFAGMFV